MEPRANLELRLKQIEGALASAIGDNQRAEAKIERLENVIRGLVDREFTYWKGYVAEGQISHADIEAARDAINLKAMK